MLKIRKTKDCDEREGCSVDVDLLLPNTPYEAYKSKKYGLFTGHFWPWLRAGILAALPKTSAALSSLKFRLLAGNLRKVSSVCRN